MFFFKNTDERSEQFKIERDKSFSGFEVCNYNNFGNCSNLSQFDCGWSNLLLFQQLNLKKTEKTKQRPRIKTCVLLEHLRKLLM